ncbi:MAG: hypothetical protein GQ570_11310 [Helicobacteraceae bacterium]|nr:hypothetical protein [Helicobacteraceae bacterium]
MSYYKLFDLKDIGLNSPSIGSLLEKLNSLGNKALISYDDIQKSIKQKLLVDKVIEFLLENKLIALNNEDEEAIYKILVELPQTSLEKESKEYLDNKLFSSLKELLIKKLESYKRNHKEAYILFLDLANSTEKYNGNVIMKNKIINKDFPKVINECIEPYFNKTKGYLISQKGDEAHLLFFNKKDLDNFIQDFILHYKNELFDGIEEFNTTRDIENDFLNKIYLKIFTAHSEVDAPIYSVNTMPNFNDMDAFTIINRIEKVFKVTLNKKGQKEVDMYFIVSTDEFKGSSTILLETSDFDINIYYKII